ncbi:MAG: DUF2786 domain-containing protein [Candidatus Latescibacterota bacterium]|nr:DUF2786 domain-containing protein [Candidatus Latescibacterota bacterium]
MTGPPAPDLRNAWLHTLVKWWKHYNHEFLRDALRLPIIELSDGEMTLGAWDGSHRRLMISARHIHEDAWTSVLDTLRHEMAHQYVDEVLKPEYETAHGPAFASACERLRCEVVARSRSASSNTALAGDQEERVIRLVRKLLSLAESPNENEAQAAMRKARRLLLEYNINLVRSDQQRQFDRRPLGDVKGRHPAWELWVAMLLSDFFFVEVLWAHSYDANNDRAGTVLEIYGTRTNLEMADYVYGFLEGLLPRLWDRYRQEQGLSDNRERMRFYAGVAQGFHEKLSTETQAEHSIATSNRSEAVNEDEHNTDLIWHGDQQLQQYYRYHNPRIVTRRTGGVAATDAFHHGVAEGRRVQIHPPVEQAGLGGYLRQADR